MEKVEHRPQSSIYRLLALWEDAVVTWQGVSPSAPAIGRGTSKGAGFTWSGINVVFGEL